MKIRNAAAAAVLAAGIATGVGACGVSATSGTVTSTSYAPPTTQTVNVSCNYMHKGFCYSWNTMQMPVPQDCTVNFRNAKGQTGSADVSVSQAVCGSYQGLEWPIRTAG